MGENNLSGGKSKWADRRRKRWAKSPQNKIKLILWIAAAAAVILLSGTLHVPQQDPAQPISIYKPDEVSAITRLLKRALADNIPGMEQPVLADDEELEGAVLRAFHSLTGLDPRDPRTFLERGLGVTAITSLPVLYPPEKSYPGVGEENQKPPGFENPKEPVPAFNPRFPLIGYNEPVALLYHNHITESFEPSSGQTFSQNLEETVAYLGDKLATLMQEQYGLPLIHHRGIYDLPRATAYEKSRPMIKEILAENPHLDLVIDLHRDGVRREITTATVNGAEVGKILFIIGTRHPGWESNLTFALGVHRELEIVAPGISRGVRRQNFSYNQDLHPHAILIEVGGHENTMDEVLSSIPYLAEALSRTYARFFTPN